MGISKSQLPENLLKRITPEDRKANQLPAPIAEQVAAAKVKGDLKREKDLQWSIVNFLRLRNVCVIWHRLDRRSGATIGCPDLLFAIRGRAVAIECKLPGEVPTADQLRVMLEMKSNGWEILIAHSLDEARAFVQEIEKRA